MPSDNKDAASISLKLFRIAENFEVGATRARSTNLFNSSTEILLISILVESHTIAFCVDFRVIVEWNNRFFLIGLSVHSRI